MDAITGTVPVVPKTQVSLPLPHRQGGESVTLPLPRPQHSDDAVDQQFAQAEAKRVARLRQAADTFVLGDQRFSFYKDSSGQYITRYTSLRDGKVTYIPEPNLLAMHSSEPNLSLQI